MTYVPISKILQRNWQSMAIGTSEQPKGFPTDVDTFAEEIGGFSLSQNFGYNQISSRVTSLIGVGCRATKVSLWHATDFKRVVVGWGKAIIYCLHSNLRLASTVRQLKTLVVSCGVHLHCRILHHIQFLHIIWLIGIRKLFRLKISLVSRMMN